MNKHKASSIMTIVMSMFTLWYVLLVMAIVTESDQAWNLVYGSPVILIPWATYDIVKVLKRR